MEEKFNETYDQLCVLIRMLRRASNKGHLSQFENERLEKAIEIQLKHAPPSDDSFKIVQS